MDETASASLNLDAVFAIVSTLGTRSHLRSQIQPNNSRLAGTHAGRVCTGLLFRVGLGRSTTAAPSENFTPTAMARNGFLPGLRTASWPLRSRTTFTTRPHWQFLNPREPSIKFTRQSSPGLARIIVGSAATGLGLIGAGICAGIWRNTDGDFSLTLPVFTITGGAHVAAGIPISISGFYVRAKHRK